MAQYFSLSDFKTGSPEYELLVSLMRIRTAWGQCLWCTELAEDNALGCINHQRLKTPVSQTT